ncbi:hypothetical protein RFI_18766 [Reticulomyxa filosa]|uniref:Uncharacterized protein n=1 Tax=Reticulomyxa filosa TaxID=46433 RepID=X6MXF9_RETFI|nr:hypothetical protein RFI_18766 [Reticulomyxa filosa]|eukprot:ETO18499.1 hypothetical protein RFI_18766 [Reticulomyxa filosa]
MCANTFCCLLHTYTFLLSRTAYSNFLKNYWICSRQVILFKQKKIDRESFMRDRVMYLPLWTSEGGSSKNKERMSMQEYRSLMSRAQTITQDTTAEVWTRIVGIDSEWCGFEQFVAMMKLTRLAQMDIPIFLIHLSKLQHYHPSTLPIFHTTSSSSSSSSSTSTSGQDMSTNVSHNHIHNRNGSGGDGWKQPSQTKPQLQQNMVAFRGLPPQVLDSDEMLMQLEKFALRHCSPIHFEVKEMF